MTSLRTSIVANKLPTNPMCPPVKQKLRKFNPNMSLNIKEEVTKQIKAKVLRVLEYPAWLANIVSVPKKYGKVKICVDYQDLNKIWMDEEDAEKIAFIIPWGVYYYKIMPFGLKNVGPTYMRVMTTIFHDMIHKEIEMYVDDVIIKSKRAEDHITDLRKFFDKLRRSDGDANFNGMGIGEVLVLETGQHYPVSAKLRFLCTNNMAEYEACILGLSMVIDMNIQELLVIGDSDFLVHQVQGEWATKNSKILPYLHHVRELRKWFTKIEFLHVPRIQNEFVDALDTLSSMIQHPNKNFIDPIQVKIHNQPAYCTHVAEEIDRKPWFHDIKEYLARREYLEHGMDVIVPIEPTASNGHRFILVAIYYFTTWVEAASYKAVTKKVIADFVKDCIIC
ncbi:uncharacterized protein [Nicotiana sylvestris]|uniref:uncharacterized protein n=1 Tax=Nicotiana sylvestris TaxID=4096 RepID=UPI00388C9B81